MPCLVRRRENPLAEPFEPAVESTPDDPSATAPAADQHEPAAPQEFAPEQVGRGILLSLLVIPAGVLAWAIIWQLGFMSAIVAFGVAVGAVWLYRRGSGGRIGAIGIAATIVVTIVTLVLAFLAGLAIDLAAFLEIDIPTAITSPEFWDLFLLNVFDNPELWEAMTGDIVFAVLFAALGAFSVFWRLAKAAKADKQTDAL